MIDKLTYLVISDIHLGHKKTLTQEIIDHLDHFFDNYSDTSRFKDIDILFIAGDLFDGLLNLPSKQIPEILLWMTRIIKFCIRHNIKLRVLEGTPSHDWKQSKMFLSVIDIQKSPVDFKYIDTLFIEHIKEFDTYILYVPDEWSSEATTTFEQVKILLKENNLTSVDLAIMHGCFHYQLNHIKSTSSSHSESDYLSIVKHYINIGHFHTYTTYDRILAQGSFDRIAHGEEEPKGGILCTIDKTQGNRFVFIENMLAKKYVSVKIKHEDPTMIFKQLDRVISKLPKESYVRVIAKKDNPIYKILDEVRVRYPYHYFTKLADEDKKEDAKNHDLFSNLHHYNAVTITEDNVVTLIMEEVSNENLLTPTKQTLLVGILEDTLCLF